MNQNDRRHRIPTRRVVTKRGDIDFNVVKFDYANYCRTTRNALGITKEEAKRERYVTSPSNLLSNFLIICIWSCYSARQLPPSKIGKDVIQHGQF